MDECLNYIIIINEVNIHPIRAIGQIARNIHAKILIEKNVLHYSILSKLSFAAVPFHDGLSKQGSLNDSHINRYDLDT